MSKHLSLDATALAIEKEQGKVHVVAHDLAYQRLGIVNVVYFGQPGAPSGRWALVDAGVMGTSGQILKAVAQRFGSDSRPAAIILTHGHFDHVGALAELAEHWEVPVYAHQLELPYLDGTASYPPPDPSVGGGLMSALAPLYPRGPVDVRQWLEGLPSDGRVPGMGGWRWLHTPGHTPGHVSLWREGDRTLIAGDAFITTDQESAYAVAVQRLEMQGPPMYYTQDWEAAEASVQRLAKLEPELAIPGHGRAVHGVHLRAALRQLAEEFAEIALPRHGRYVSQPARPQDPASAYRSVEE